MNTTTDTAKKVPGRPVNPESERQKRLRELEEKRNDPNFRLGRPVKPNSKRQQELAKKSDPNYKPQKGRPKMTEEEKQRAREEREKRRQELLAKTLVVSEEITPIMVTEGEVVLQTPTDADTKTPTEETVVAETPIDDATETHVAEATVSKKSRRKK